MKNLIRKTHNAILNTQYAILITLILVCLILPQTAHAATYNLDFSTYLGGSDWDNARDIFVDKQGYIYVVGATHSTDFPTTPGAYDRTFDASGTQVGSDGPLEAFISKFSPDGVLVWSTFLGGPNYDRAYAVEVDDQGYVYVAGRAGPGFPTSANSFQPNFKGWNQGRYGWQNAFVAKLSPDGSNLLWASYVGLSSMCRDIAIDKNGDIYLPLGYNNQGDPGSLPAAWFSNAFQKTTQGGPDCGIIKISNDGTKVHWATWLGGSGNDNDGSSVRVDDNGYVYIGMNTQSDDIPTTPGAADRSYNGMTDYYVAKLSPDGSNLEFGTYLGGSGNEWHSTHNLAIDKFGNVYAAPWTDSSNYPTTSGAFQESIGGGNSEIAVTKLSPTGGMIASTFIGGSGEENPDGIYVGADGNVYISGESGSTDLPVTANAYQSVNSGGHDAILLILSADFSQLLYSTYMGGGSTDGARSGFMDSQGNLYITGSTDGPGWPTKNAVQDYFAGGGWEWGTGDVIVAKFSLDLSFLYGDVSGNGEISAYDAALAAMYAVGLIDLQVTQIQAADVSGDGGVSAYDAALIAQRAVGLINRFPIE